MSKFFGALLFVAVTLSSQTAFAWDGHRGGYDRGSYPVYNDYGGGRHHNYGDRHYGHHSGGHHNNRDLWLGLAIGTGIGIIASQPPTYYSSPPVYYQQSVRHCWWEPEYRLDRYGNIIAKREVEVCTISRF